MGRQMLRMVYDWFMTDKQAGPLNDYEDITCVTYHAGQYEQFIANWDSVIEGMEHEPPDDLQLVLFYKQAKNMDAIKFDLQIYERAEVGSYENSYDFLRAAIKRHIDKERQKKSRAQIHAAIRGGQTAARAKNNDMKEKDNMTLRATK